MSVCVLHVGGTIGMVPSTEGLVPGGRQVSGFLYTLHGLEGLPDWTFTTSPPLMDSADMRPADWVRIARAIAGLEASGIVVLHGTDTMAYTASAVSFLLQGVDRPIIFTGAQLPLGHLRSDGRDHIITSLMLAAMPDLTEVGLFFGDKLLRANRAQKVDSRNFVAFDSGNLPPLATSGVEIDVAWPLVRKPTGGPMRVRTLIHEPEVIAVRVYPGISAKTLGRTLEAPVEAVVLETYGAGTFPSSDAALLKVVRDAVDRGVVVASCSQVHAGRVQSRQYGTGAALADAGVVSGHDMTPEAALTKLWCLLAEGFEPKEVRRLFLEDLAGEVTPTPTRRQP